MSSWSSQDRDESRGCNWKAWNIALSAGNIGLAIINKAEAVGDIVCTFSFSLNREMRGWWWSQCFCYSGLCLSLPWFTITVQFSPFSLPLVFSWLPTLSWREDCLQQCSVVCSVSLNIDYSSSQIRTHANPFLSLTRTTSLSFASILSVGKNGSSMFCNWLNNLITFPCKREELLICSLVQITLSENCFQA